MSQGAAQQAHLAKRAGISSGAVAALSVSPLGLAASKALTSNKVVPSLVFALVVCLMLSRQAFAVLPGEMLADPALEARARAISAELRCMVCQNQSIDDSDADLAHDLRVLVRERILAGDTDSQAIDYIVARYGEFVLLKPKFSLQNALLWGTPVVLLLAGGAFVLAGARARQRRPMKLSADEEAALSRILKGDGA